MVVWRVRELVSGERCSLGHGAVLKFLRPSVRHLQSRGKQFYGGARACATCHPDDWQTGCMSTMDAQATGDAAAIFPAPNGELQEEEDAVEQPKEPSKRRRNKKKRSGRAAPSSAADEASQLLRDPSGILQVVMTPDCGRGVVAVVPVAAGTTVLSERAAAAVCFATTAHAHCAHCLRAGVVTKCADCDAVAFCSSECAATHAALHANECRVLAALPSVAQECGVDPTLLRLVLRCIVRRHMESESGADRDAGSAESAAPSGCRIATQADVRLLHDTGEAEAAAEWRESVCKGLAVMQDLLPPALAVPPPEAERLARMINLNCHGLKDQQGRNTDVVRAPPARRPLRDAAAHTRPHAHWPLTQGVGLFPMVAMMNHSCRPNCVFVPAAHLPGTLEVRTTMKVAAGDALTVSYIDTYQVRCSRAQRQRPRLTRCARHSLEQTAGASYSTRSTSCAAALAAITPRRWTRRWRACAASDAGPRSPCARRAATARCQRPAPTAAPPRPPPPPTPCCAA